MGSPLRVPMTPLASGDVRLGDETARYVLRVHRLGEGDALTLFDPIARSEADGVVLDASRDAATVRIGEVRGASLLPSRSVALLQGVAKGDKMDAIVRDATELGVTRVVPVIAARSVAVRSSHGVRARWERIAVEAARQCGRGDVPEISEPVPFDAALLASNETVRVALVPGASTPLGEVVRRALASDRELGALASIAVAVGPEGGFDDAEIEALAARGFMPASLGRFVLRTETASTAALAVLVDAASLFGG